MVDFKKKLGASKLPARTPLETFFALDRKSSRAYPRTAQEEVLKSLAEYSTARNIVLKMPTGAGKTLVGLVLAANAMARTRKPALFLCGTKQLVTQVVNEGLELGVPVIAAEAGGNLPNNYVSAKSVLACTYDKLFNARSVFEQPRNRQQHSLIILDDAHAGIEKVRAKFSIRSNRGKDPATSLWHQMVDILHGHCSIEFTTKWDSIRECSPHEAVEIPYWIWSEKLDSIRKVLRKLKEDTDVGFSLANIEDHLRWCRCALSGDSIEIAIPVPDLGRIRTFVGAQQRLFMSATFADTSVLISEFGLSEAEVKAAVSSNSLRSGERMILAPDLMCPEFDRKWIIGITAKLSQKFNTVVLTTSNRQLKDWELAGARTSEAEDVDTLVSHLKATPPLTRFVALAQRFDGVDLPDDACRILVIDGLPTGESLLDTIDDQSSDSPLGARSGKVLRLEQGLGRAVRSQSDYALVILVGVDLANFVSKEVVLSELSAETRAQLNIGRELSKDVESAARSTGDDAQALESAKSEFIDLIEQCLFRDADWREYHHQSVEEEQARGQPDSQLAKLWTILAVSDAKVWGLIFSNDLVRAESELRASANKVAEERDRILAEMPILKPLDNELRREEARRLQLAANIKHDVNPGAALGIQREAWTLSRGVARPRVETECVEFNIPIRGGLSIQSAKLLGVLREYKNGGGFSSGFASIKPKLTFGPDTGGFERAFAEVPKYLGGEGWTVDNGSGNGPDVAWLVGNTLSVIEVKSDASYAEVPKKDIGQLLTSYEWGRKEAKRIQLELGRTIDVKPVMVVPCLQVDRRGNPPPELRLMTPSVLGEFLAAVSGLAEKFSKLNPERWTDDEAKKMLVAAKLTMDVIWDKWASPPIVGAR